MRIAILTNEYPPYVYGGAGVHVEYLTRELARIEDGHHTVNVISFGDQEIHQGNLTVRGINPGFSLPYQDPRHKKFGETMLRDLVMAGMLKDVDVVHCHTWYTHLAGCLVKQLTGAKLVLTTHSLEPHRPWKVEQLGTAYNASSWVERTAYENADGVVAVSESMREDVHDLYGVPYEKIRIIHNGIDLNQYTPTRDPAVLATIQDRPGEALRALRRPDHPAEGDHPPGERDQAHPPRRPGRPLRRGPGHRGDRPGDGRRRSSRPAASPPTPIIWIAQIVPKEDIIPLYTHASVFVCPSVYEPFGIINLEAMACETPVVASAVGGIKEVVIPGKTGLLVPFEPISAANFEPQDPGQVRPRPRRRRQPAPGRPREAPRAGPALPRARRALLQLDQHRPLDARLLLRPGAGAVGGGGGGMSRQSSPGETDGKILSATSSSPIPTCNRLFMFKYIR